MLFKIYYNKCINISHCFTLIRIIKSKIMAKIIKAIMIYFIYGISSCFGIDVIGSISTKSLKKIIIIYIIYSI